MHRILVPLDGSELAEQILPLTIAMAKAFGSEVELFYVVDTAGMPHTIEWKGQVKVDTLFRWMHQRATEYVTGVQARLAETGLNVSHQVVFGSPGVEIGVRASSRRVGLIAMSTHGRSGLARWALGSVADKVLRAATVPLLLFHPKADAAAPAVSIKTILLPLDGAPEAESAVPLARRMAEALNVPVRVARAVPALPFSFDIESPDVMAEVVQDMTAEATEYLDATVEELRGEGLTVDKTLLMGDPAAGLIDWMGNTKGCLVVMSTLGRSGLDRAVLGSVTDKVIRSGVAPVIVIAPEAARVQERAYATAAHGAGQ